MVGVTVNSLSDRQLIYRRWDERIREDAESTINEFYGHGYMYIAVNA